VKYKITFERIGRSHRVPPLELPADRLTDADVADKVYIYARPYLASRGYDVYADLQSGKGSIEGGRFGTFTIEAVDA
jgi:hypothetical protein